MLSTAYLRHSLVRSSTFGRSFSTASAIQIQYPRSRADGVGIVAMDMYVPKRFVDQSRLEEYDNVSSGRYTVGLDQKRMAFTGDREDINSICMSAVQRLLDANGISFNDIGRLEIGTETIVDKSKSVKTTMMDMFAASGNTNVEGIDTTNACYGGTQALLNSLAWVESSAWDGRYAIAVAGDIAVYDKGNARPTGGCGAIAMLIGPNATLVAEPGLRHSYMENAYDFYKPDLSSEYPRVDGQLSIECYLRALDSCYQGYLRRLKDIYGETMNTRSIDFACFHTPFNKLVTKSYARMLYNDALLNPSDEFYAPLKPFLDLSPSQSYKDRDLEKAALELAKPLYEEKVRPSTEFSRHVGNTYCGSLYGGLLSLLDNVEPTDLQDRRVMMFSYGSGLAASLFSLRVAKSPLEIRDRTRVMERLNSRQEETPESFSTTLDLRERTHTLSPYSPTESLDTIEKGAYYLDYVDEEVRRFYRRKE